MSWHRTLTTLLGALALFNLTILSGGRACLMPQGADVHGVIAAVAPATAGAQHHAHGATTGERAATAAAGQHVQHAAHAAQDSRGEPVDGTQPCASAVPCTIAVTPADREATVLGAPTSEERGDEKADELSSLVMAPELPPPRTA